MPAGVDGVGPAGRLSPRHTLLAGRVLDLLREWDKDGDGEISRQEFHEAMIKMGLEAPKKDIDDLFSEWDSDGGGTLEFKELKEILAKSNRQNLASAKKPKK